MTDVAGELQRHLGELRTLRGDPASAPVRLGEVKSWQAQRLAATYADMTSQPRYAAATRFFLDDLYGPKDFSARDEAMLRIVPVMRRVLPAAALETAALAIELEALSEALDHRVAAALPAGPIDTESYCRAYRDAGTPGERARQVDLILAVGERLDVLVARPFILTTLKLMRRPAKLAGLADLQDFLERGFEAFGAMDGSQAFLDAIEDRERAIAAAIFAGTPLAFAPP